MTCYIFVSINLSYIHTNTEWAKGSDQHLTAQINFSLHQLMQLWVVAVIRFDHGCQIALARFLDCMCLALRASGLWLRYATLQNLIPSFHWIAPPRPPPWHQPWRNPRKRRRGATFLFLGSRWGLGQRMILVLITFPSSSTSIHCKHRTFRLSEMACQFVTAACSCLIRTTERGGETAGAPPVSLAPSSPFWSLPA